MIFCAQILPTDPEILSRDPVLQEISQLQEILSRDALNIRPPVPGAGEKALQPMELPIRMRSMLAPALVQTNGLPSFEWGALSITPEMSNGWRIVVWAD